MARRHRTAFAWSAGLPILPFLSIMLGLMSVMALTTMALSVERRQQAVEGTRITLTGVPANFIPVQIRCTRKGIRYRDRDGAWQDVPLLGLLSLVQPAETSIDIPAARRFRAFLTAKAEANKALSYQRRQHSLILWVEPEGLYAKALVEWLISRLQLPLRTGSLPLMPDEEVVNDDQPTP